MRCNGERSAAEQSPCVPGSEWVSRRSWRPCEKNSFRQFSKNSERRISFLARGRRVRGGLRGRACLSPPLHESKGDPILLALDEIWFASAFGYNSAAALF